MLQMNKEVTAQAVTAMSEPPAATGLFLVFASEKYYPQGGFNDFLCVALSLEEARRVIFETDIYLGSYQIVNYKNLEVVEAKEINRLN
ncbi:hypothetical protein P1A145kb_p173 [Pectobacterium phage DU_PP_I]|uniref:Uncharacterized protein n=1 Tax=Cronobacter phage CR8 TaxID=1327934 RepID=A0A060ACR6_9CAUD|nr:hypothetical protein HL10_gp185 [Cronobacter phage CR8]AIA64715.1 hypothetical protein CR8_185 [Cronobacter phage CR8]ATS93573.1 hypothetical protein P1A145kb_p173 [Pectobacterium phage DU_PP_I]ATS93890.1 hypothetical protein P12B145kb_p174 [Pectobacterium phage DU_PP_IV]